MFMFISSVYAETAPFNSKPIAMSYNEDTERVQHKPYFNISG